MTQKLPELIAHADWGTDARKRWMTRAMLGPDGGYRAEASEPVTSGPQMLGSLRGLVGPEASVLVGFDFPIGLPASYAKAAGIDSFSAFLLEVGRGRFSEFFDVAERRDEISLSRPFYPMRPGGTKQAHLLAAHGVSEINELRRRCELSQSSRRAACPLFWTLGGQQVGKGAISGWKEVLGPAARGDEFPFAVWPFDGSLDALVKPGQVVAAETYPAEFYVHLGVGFPPSKKDTRTGKRVQADRAGNTKPLLHWASDAGVDVAPDLRAEIQDGFGDRNDGEDRFDAVVGLFGMLNVVLGNRSSGEPDTELVQKVEGWILGQIPE